MKSFKLSPRNKDILKLRKNRYTLGEIGKKYGVTRQTIYTTLKRIEKKGHKIQPKVIPY